MPNEKITVVIVSYNSYKALVQCMDEWLSKPACRVIIVDNASTDNSAVLLGQRYPSVEVVAESVNLGYGRGANRGFEMVKTPYSLLLNPDIVCSVEKLEQLLSRAESLSNNFAILSPAVTDKDFTQSGLHKKTWVIGAAMLFNMKSMADIGFFDKRIFLFSEETDLCLRVVNANLSIYLDSDIYLNHLLKQSSTPSLAVENLKNWHSGWSKMYYRRKHGLNVGKKAEWRVIFSYFVRYLFATNSLKRLAYRARLAGSLAFILGKQAFYADGSPRTL